MLIAVYRVLAWLCSSIRWDKSILHRFPMIFQIDLDFNRSIGNQTLTKIRNLRKYMINTILPALTTRILIFDRFRIFRNRFQMNNFSFRSSLIRILYLFSIIITWVSLDIRINILFTLIIDMIVDVMGVKFMI